ncbi:MAG: hypothetical protein ABR502_11210 [Chitinophagaceae bacterium]
MRKIFLLSFLFAALTIQAQDKELKDVQENISKGKYREAKEKIDKILADPKNQSNSSAWYYKGVIYNELGKDTTTVGFDNKVQAFNAFKRYQELDQKNVLMILEQNARLFQLYENYYNEGIRRFNAKQYDEAFRNFQNGLLVKDYVHGKGYSINNFSFSALDTQLVNLAGSAAILAKQEEAAIPYFRQIADVKLKGADFKDVYPILVDYYSRKNDAANKAKYLALGKELYPENPYWVQVQLDGAGTDKKQRLATIEGLVAQDPNNYNLTMDYAVELFNYTYATDKPADYAARQVSLTDVLKKAAAMNNASPQANFIMTQHLSNQVYDLQQNYNAIKGTKPEDVKRKQQIQQNLKQLTEQQFTYALAAYQMFDKMATLKPADIANFRSVTNQLIEYYRIKKQADKVKVYEDRLKTIK